MNKPALPVRMSVRWLVPLFLVVFALMALTTRYAILLDGMDNNVTNQEIRRLRERLNADQSQLDAARGTDTAILQRRIVTTLGLHDGVTHAYLIGPDRNLAASLSRFDIGRTLDEVSDTAIQPLKELAAAPYPTSLQVFRAKGTPTLLARAPTQSGMELLVQSDLTHPLAVGKANIQTGTLRAAAFLFMITALLAAMLHIFWFRRAMGLARALTAMGQGDLTTRAGLKGGDELALLGSAADNMAGQLQASQEQVQRLNGLVNRSPLVVLEWRNEAGWPLAYASESIKQWGYSPAELISGSLAFSNLIHPDDLERITQDVAQHLAHGPDYYQQVYRIRHKDGNWLWVDDRTSLVRDAEGKVTSISGILLDITAQKIAEQVQLEQATQLGLFFELPFLGMAISSPANKRWLQVNTSLCEILGYSREELLSMSWAEMTPPGDLERNVTLFDELVAGHRNHYEMEKRFVRKDGAIVHTEIVVRAVRDDKGSVSQLFATIRDVTERKATQEALRSNENKLREAQRIGRMGSWERRLDSNQATWSDEMYRILEVDPVHFNPSVEALLERTLEEDRPRVSGAVQYAMAHGGKYESRFRISMPDGRVKHLNTRGEVEEVPGHPAKMTGTLQDMTEQIAAQSALEESETLLAEAQRIARLGHVSIDLLAGKAVGSTEFYRLMNFDPVKQTPTFGTLLQLVHPDDLERVKGALQFAQSHPSHKRFQFDHRIASGNVERYIETRGEIRFDAAGRAVQLDAILLDITDRKGTELVLQNYREMLEQAEALVKLGSWVIESKSQRLTISNQLFRNMGLEPSNRAPTDEQYLGRIHPDDRDMVAQDMQRIRSDLPVGELVFRTDPAWGPVRWMRRTVQRVPGNKVGQALRHIGILLDISDSVEAQEKLQRANDELEQRVLERTEQLSAANSELEAFSYTVSHDLKAPLRGIDGYSQLLEEEYGHQLGEEGVQFVQRIRNGVGQMSDLISDLLQYSRMERNDIRRTPLALQPVVENILASHLADIEKFHVKVNLALNGVILPLDPEGIALVMRNLIGNALKFSQGQAAPMIEIGHRSEAGRRILWVRDNGVGFDMAYHDRIFNIFQRLHRSEEFPGTGVGLALVAKAVHRMGGRVWAESTLGEGATFYLEFSE